MKPFHTIAIPHKDILEGRLTMDVFAADLWEVYQNRGAEEYRDAETFFKKTYITHGLQNLLNVVENRVTGKGGDPIIQIQTPFGGGKTHAMIAMYHKAAEWNVKRVVIEHYDEGAEKLYQQLQKVAGRLEKIYTPVEESEITWIIRKRLFSDINEHTTKKIVSNFVGYAEKEDILPAGSLSTEYRDRFISSYPFMPEVTDTLYHHWGSYPIFQRTRGVLRCSGFSHS